MQVNVMQDCCKAVVYYGSYGHGNTVLCLGCEPLCLVGLWKLG